MQMFHKNCEKDNPVTVDTGLKKAGLTVTTLSQLSEASDEVF